MQISDIRLNGDMKETVLYEDPLFNHSFYCVEYDTYFPGEVPWHWHDEIELISIVAGSALYKTGRQEYILHAGDAIFLNTGFLHLLRPLEAGTISHAHLFGRTLLSGTVGNSIDIRYLTPVLTQKQVEALPLYHTNAAARPVLALLQQADTLCEQQEPFFELRLRRVLSTIWEWIYTQVQQQLQHSKTPSGTNDADLKAILLYIQQHYAEDLQVADLAAVINVSDRECYRLFQTQMDISPIAFLQQYRLRHAQALLLNSNCSITEIAMNTGFHSSSYFGKVFRRATGMTPLEYRKHQHA